MIRLALATLAMSAALSLAACKGGSKEAGEEHGDEKGHSEHEGEDPGAEPIVIPAEAFKNAGIKVEPAKEQDVTSLIEATAEVALHADRTAIVSSRISGRVAKVSASLGDVVKKGEALATLDSPVLGRAKAEFLQAQTKAEVAKERFKRERDLLAKRVTSQAEVRAAETESIAAGADEEAAEENLRSMGLSVQEVEGLRHDQHYQSTYTVRAPLAGTVVARDLTLGQAIEPSQALFTVADLSDVWVVAKVFEKDVARVAKGNPATVTIEALEGEQIDGVVEWVADVIDESTRTAGVRVVVPNAGRKLKAGMFARARIHAAPRGGARKAAITVPEAAIQRAGTEFQVYVQTAERTFLARPVTIGERSGGLAEITSGLKVGELVVVDGGFVLKSEQGKESMGEHGH